MKHLTDADRSALAERLGAMRRQVLDELIPASPTVLARGALNATQEVHTRADEAEAGREDDVLLAEAEVDRQRLRDIEVALNRMADGRYGICVCCGDEIPRERLIAQPIAIRCATCQANFEKRSA
ncbi:TraR/DksA family transcriptional regulator [Variovorax sp.]|uniref:TraR/DksA family transcriptional regulator n=1 Tax=Variovorax sp. TaxID=1871043 RepID=UPI002D610504|nr:TraR/DksA family transcriptional regulator [Variovorax sp.]HYP85980.1 TraR/DksA family transcriptional regulator [Variovorax sp.]